jgi:5-methylcytosine-specific restriction endonuclease McrA
MTYDPVRYQEKKEIYAAYHKKYRDKNREAIREKHKIYKEKNREKYTATERRRRASKRNAASEVYTIADVLNKYGTSCHICNKKIDLAAERRPGRKGWENGLHIDHLVEISQGGDDSLSNVRPAHGLCNLQRNNKKSAIVN